MYHQDAFVAAAGKAGDSSSVKGNVPAASASQTTLPGAGSAPSGAASSSEAAGQTAAGDNDGPIIADFDKIISGPLAKLSVLSQELDPVLGQQLGHLVQAYEIESQFLRAAVKSRPPSLEDPAFQDIYKRISKRAEEVIALREKNRGSKVLNHLSTIAEGVPALGWISVDDTIDYIVGFRDSSLFYSNRVLKEFKDSDKKHVEWVKLHVEVLAALLDYAKKYHPKGVAWNPSGVSLADALSELSKDVPAAAAAAAPSPAPSAGGPPPPPPPPPMPSAEVFQAGSSTSSGTEGGMGAVFSELNKGESVTAGLKKVDKSQMTHKNPDLRKQAPKVPEKKVPTLPKKPAQLSKTAPKKGVPKKEFVDSKWILENLEDDHDVVLELELDHGVFIDRCTNCTIQIKGKGNAVSINQCKKIGVLIDSLVSGASVIKSSGIGIQVTGVVATISIDQSENSQIYLSEKSINADIYTAQTASINVNVPRQGGPEGDYVEVALPEQIVHKISAAGELTSNFVQHA